MTRVVVTGIGVVSPVGTGRAAFWRNLTAGRSGVQRVTLFDTAAMPVAIGGQVTDWEETATRERFGLGPEQRDRKVLLGLSAAEEAVRDAHLTADLLREAVFCAGVGLEMFHLDDITPFAREENIPGALSRAVLAGEAGPLVQTPLDRLGELVVERFGMEGECIINGSACAAGAQVVGEALRLIQDGEATTALAGAADSMLNPLGLGGFSLLRVLAAGSGDPRRACRPFDADRSGAVLGEGAAFLVLECRDQAAARGARAYADVLGYGSSMDAFALSDPEPTGQGARLSMAAAMRDAGLTPADVDAVSAHGTGTVKNDVVETAAIRAVLGARAEEIPVHAVKSMTGHLIAASGAVEAAAAALTLHHATIPPTINLDRPDPQCDLDYVPHHARPFAGRTVLSNSFGFGGQNATLLFGRTQP